MWIKLDFTPLFVGGLIAGLIVMAIGFAIRANLPNRSTIGIIVVVIGLIPALAGGILLAMDAAAKWTEAKRSRRSTEKLAEDREIQGVRFPRGTTVEWLGSQMDAVVVARPLTVTGVRFEDRLSFSNTITNGYRLAATEVGTGMLTVAQAIDGVPCQAHREVEFFSQGGSAADDGRAPMVTRGKLRRCTLSADFERAANRYRAGSEITFQPSGGVALGVLVRGPGGGRPLVPGWNRGGTSRTARHAIHAGPRPDRRRDRLQGRARSQT